MGRRAATADVTDKATGETTGIVADANAADIAKACKQALAAAPAWAAVAPSERARIDRKAGELLSQHKDEAVYWLVREAGSTRCKAEFKLLAAENYFDHAADLLSAPWRTSLEDTSGSVILGRSVASSGRS